MSAALPTVAVPTKVEVKKWSSTPKSTDLAPLTLNREVLRRPRDDAEDHQADLLLTPAERRDPLIPAIFWRRAYMAPVNGLQHFQILDRVTIDRGRYPQVRHCAHFIDIHPDIDTVKAYNKGVDWPHALFKKEGPAGCYFSPKPGPIFHKAEKETCSAHFVDLHFSLDSSSRTHEEFLNQTDHPWNADGEIRIKMKADPRVFKALFGQNGIPEDQEHDYHALVLALKLTAIRSTFPIAMQMWLESKLPHASSRVAAATELKERKSRKFLSKAEEKAASSLPEPAAIPTHAVWSNVSGVSCSGQPTYYTVMPCQTACRNPGGDFLYMIAEAVVNHPDFSRFIMVDFHELRQELAKRRIDSNFYRITPEAADKWVFENLAVWFAVEHFPLLAQLTDQLTDLPDPRDRLYMEWDGGHFDVPVKALDEVVTRQETVYDRDAFLVSFEEITLVLKPEKGIKGWEEYRQIIAKRLFSSIEGSFAQFDAVLELAFEPYQVEKDTKLLAMQSSSYFGNAVSYTTPDASLVVAPTPVPVSRRGPDAVLPLDAASSAKSMHELLGSMHALNNAKDFSQARQLGAFIQNGNGQRR